MNNNALGEEEEETDVDYKNKASQSNYSPLSILINRSVELSKDILFKMSIFMRRSTKSNKIDNVIPIKELEDHSDTIQLQNNHDEVVKIKRKLNAIGYGGIKVNNYFGSFTQKRIREFQEDFNLPITGELNRTTSIKIDEVFLKIYHEGSNHKKILELKQKLNKLGFGELEETYLLDAQTTKRVRDFQFYYGLEATGKVDLHTIKEVNSILNSPLQRNKRNSKTLHLKKSLHTLGYNNVNFTNEFSKLTEDNLKQFQTDYNLPVSGIGDERTLKRIKEAIDTKGRASRIEYNITLDEAIKMQISSGNKMLDDIPFSKIEKLLDPVYLENDDKNKFQFLDLGRTNVTNVKELEKLLINSQLLTGKAETFKNAGTEMGINEVYLMLQILNNIQDKNNVFIELPVDCNGNITYIKNAHNNKFTKKPGYTSETDRYLYNFIPDFDTQEDAIKRGFQENWVTLDRAIYGAAKYYKDKYINTGRNTYYKMYWNPDFMERNKYADTESTKYLKQYTISIETVYNAYRKLESYILYLEIPEYK
ncbi:peptidoglycan-binding protein [Virgibacillus halodenitrificans]|uniref:peptidoglycan-binding protein n=1 Tax=Virgibacillus halodenitrificans TaxID=1482 RepID=UPI000761C5FE